MILGRYRVTTLLFHSRDSDTKPYQPEQLRSLFDVEGSDASCSFCGDLCKSAPHSLRMHLLRCSPAIEKLGEFKFTFTKALAEEINTNQISCKHLGTLAPS